MLYRSPPPGTNFSVGRFSSEWHRLIRSPDAVLSPVMRPRQRPQKSNRDPQPIFRYKDTLHCRECFARLLQYSLLFPVQIQRQMREQKLSHLFVAEKSPQLVCCKVGEFTNQQVNRTAKLRFQIDRSPQIAGKQNSKLRTLNEKTVCLESSRPEFLHQRLEVGSFACTN